MIVSYITAGNARVELIKSWRELSPECLLARQRLCLRLADHPSAISNRSLLKLHASSTLVLFRNISTALERAHPSADRLLLTLSRRSHIRANMLTDTVGRTETGLVPGCHAPTGVLQTPLTKEGSVSQSRPALRIAEKSNSHSSVRRQTSLASETRDMVQVGFLRQLARSRAIRCVEDHQVLLGRRVQPTVFGGDGQ